MASVPFLLTTALACTSSDEKSTSPDAAAPPTSLSPAQEADLAAQICDAYSVGDRQCQKTDEADVHQDCLSGIGLCFARTMVPAGIAAFTRCMNGSNCSAYDGGGCTCAKSDDDCFHEAGISLPPSAIRDAYINACQTKLAACGKDSNSFSDDWCTYGGYGMELFTETLFQSLTTCFQNNACGNGTISQCLTAKQAELSGNACKKD